MTEIVLVPGAWLGGWAWEDVAGRLRAAGHRPHPVTLAGVAERAGETPARTIDLDTHTENLVSLLVDRDLREVVLVGHSYGGFPVTAAAAQVPERVAHVVYVDSGPPPAGMAQVDFSEPEEQQRLRAQLGDDGRLPPPAWDPAHEPHLDGLDQAALALLRRRSTPHPFGSLLQPSHAPAPAVPATVVTCLFPAEQVRAMIEEGHPFFAALGGAQLRELPTGHWPMLSEPERLAAILAEVANEVANKVATEVATDVVAEG